MTVDQLDKIYIANMWTYLMKGRWRYYVIFEVSWAICEDSVELCSNQCRESNMALL
jgi:hypothetical protein